MNHHATIDSILRMFDVAGRDAYFGEAVSQTEHALQSANLAVNAGADAELVVAAVHYVQVDVLTCTKYQRSYYTNFAKALWAKLH